ncbi:MAG: sensor histidine kinase [Ancrocorticia sp.]|uniref:sensor histidine kinase n=1 Tax=Ancrocorticia sp. TaxID=2593684 RepID=UPI003F912D81
MDHDGEKRTPHPAALIINELAHAVVWIFEIIAVVLTVFLVHITVPALAEVERWIGRIVGAETPSERHGSKMGKWLSGRVATADFWKRDLPVTLSTLLVSTASFFLAFVGLVLAATFMVAPFISGPDRPVIQIGDWIVDGPVSKTWWLILIGIAVVVLLFWLLWLLGKIRVRIIESLATTPDEANAAELRGQVTGLRKGRITLVDAFEAERTRIERDLHDGTQQELVALTMKLGAARVAAGSDDPEARARLLPLIEEAQSQAESSLRQLREVVHGIHPAVLTDLGLKAAVEDLCARSGLDVHVRVTGGSEPALPVATAVYFALSETLTNVAKHSGTNQATLELELGDAEVSAVVGDQGTGGATPAETGHGLAGISERLEVVGGGLRVESTAGEGTQVHICAPTEPDWS